MQIRTCMAVNKHMCMAVNKHCFRTCMTQACKMDGYGDDVQFHTTGGASKAGLKNAKAIKHKRKAKKEEKEISSPGDLLGDLSAALGRRRKALSGKDKAAREREEKREDHNLGGGAMMDNISKMIPPPPSSTSGLESSGKNIEDSGAW